MGRRGDTSKKAKELIKKSISIEGQENAGNNSSNAPSGNDAALKIGNQAFIDLQEDEDLDVSNDRVQMSPEEVDEFNKQFEDQLLQENQGNEQANADADLQNEEIGNEIIDDKNVEDKKSAVGELANVVNQSAQALEEKAEEFKENGNEAEAEGAKQTVNEINQINQNMQQVKAYNFTQIPKAKQKPSKWNKFWTKATSFFGGITKGLVNLISAPVALYKYGTSKHRFYKAVQKAIDASNTAKNYDKIPGWEGAEFNRKKNETVDDLLGDARRVPAVWSYLTAGEADKEVDGKKQIIDPEISIMVDQAGEGSSEHMVDTEIGHAFIGISYSRYSNITGKNERYNLQYGFYPAGGMARYATTAMALRGAMVPGELKDDRSHAYTVSRRYPASMEQLGKILKASEEYAAGGYGYYKRNCTTFVKEMAVDIGQVVSSGDSIFKEHSVVYDVKSQLMKYLGHTAETYVNAAARNEMAKYATQEDMTYQNYGNTRMNAREMLQFDKTTDAGLSDRRGYIPGEVGEALRYNNVDGGKIGSYSSKGSLIANNAEESSIDDVSYALVDESENLRGKIQRVLTDENLEAAPADLKKFYDELNTGTSPVKLAVNGLYGEFIEACEKNKIEPTKELYEMVGAQDIKNARIKAQAGLDEMGTIYEKYLGHDKRLNLAMMKLFSIYQIAITYLDSQYEKAITQKFTNSDNELADSVVLLNKGQKIFLQERETALNLTPSYVEGLAQVYKGNIAEGLRDHYKLIDLQTKEEQLKAQGKKLSKSEKIQKRKLEMRTTLAEEFAKSHRYMLEKKEYNQQDISYVMKLRDYENDAEGIGGDLLINISAAMIYQNLIVQSLFGGIRDAYFSDYDGGRKDEDFDKVRNDEDVGAAVRMKWISEYVQKRIKEKPDRFRDMIQALYLYKNKDAQEAVIAFALLFLEYFKNTSDRAGYTEPRSMSYSSLTEFIMEAIVNYTGDFIKSFIGG